MHCTPVTCEKLVDNDYDTYFSVINDLNPWFNINFNFNVSSAAVRIFSFNTGYFKIETSLDTKSFSTCNTFYKSDSQLELGTVFKCVSLMNSIRIVSLNNINEVKNIFEFQVFGNFMLIYYCECYYFGNSLNN